MYYVRQDQKNINALDLIKEVLSGYQEIKNQKEQEIDKLLIIENYQRDELITLEKEVEIISSQISAVLYTYEYVKLMLNVADKLK